MQLHGQPITYAPKSAFHRDVMETVDHYFQRTGLKRRGDVRMYLKALGILAWAALSYAGLVFRAEGWLEGTLWLVSLALASAAIPMCIGHDGSHKAFSDVPLLNGLAAHSLLLVGMNTYWWRSKHDILHHGYTGLAGMDDDLDQGNLLRLADASPWQPWQRFQHIYAWALYPFLHVAMFVAGLRFVVTGRVGVHQFQRPNARQATLTALGAAWLLGMAILLPASHHALWQVLIGACAWSMITGFVLVTIFQTGHCVELASAPAVCEESGLVSCDWATNQVEVAVDVCSTGGLLSAYAGGLNFHVEHHLLPRVSHVHHVALAPLVADVCRRHGLEHHTLPSWSVAFGSHQRRLRELGMAPSEAPSSPAHREAPEESAAAPREHALLG